MTDGFTRRKEQSKEDIRKAGWELFSQFGIEKVSIVDIARKAGVSQATIYNNFGSKEALVREFVTAIIDQMVNRIEEVLVPEKPFWEKVADVIQTISLMMAQGPSTDSNTSIFNINYDLLNDPDIQKIRESAQDKMTNLLLRLVHEGKEQGQIQPSLSDDTFRVYFRAFIDIFPTPQFRKQYRKDPRIVSDLGQLMINGLSGK